MKNLDIRIRISDSGLKYKDIARALGISPEYFSRLMAKPLSEKKRREVLLTIDALTKGNQENDI